VHQLTFVCFLFASLLSPNTLGQGLGVDQLLDRAIRENGLLPLKKIIPTASKREVSRLGSMLFHEVELSGNRNINCASCHHPRFGTGDSVPFSIGEGGVGLGPQRLQKNAGVTRRHSPHLLNLGYPDITEMFWDGRVSRNPSNGQLLTPEPALNGANPEKSDIAKALTSALAAQAIFPLVNALEMRGESGNDIADTDGNLAAWSAIMKRLLEGNSAQKYQTQFSKAYPKQKKFNIGHVGQALGVFIGNAFNIVDTPYDRYLLGDRSALKESEKRGLLVFTGRGKCIKCHNGAHLSNFEYKTVGVPQLTPIAFKEPFDEGRFEVTGQKRDLFKFKTPSLRNLMITAPYMHNGAFDSLEKVIDHYSDPAKSLSNFRLDSVDLSAYTSSFVVDQDKLRNKLRINLISIGEVRRGLALTAKEKADLLVFLKNGLLDYRFQPQR
jgi:cytochrome c peroxidase